MRFIRGGVAVLNQILRVFAFLVLAQLAVPAAAEWYRASTDHFVIYADDSEKDIRQFAENLERYHAALELLTGAKVEKPSPSNRITIFAIGSERDMRRLSGSDRVAGFYIPRAGASRAFVQDIRNRTGGYPDFSMTILLHEYAHHFLMSQSRYAMPRWFNEGAAEFYASASFDRDGSLWIGRPAKHRAGELFYEDKMDVAEVLTYGRDNDDERELNDAFYGRAWLLYHYLSFDKEREGQLLAYKRAIARGANPLKAGQETFGDLKALQNDVDRYLKARRVSAYKLPPDLLAIGPISVRALPEGEAKMMEVRVRSQRGVDEELAAELVVEAREIADAYPQDAGVLTALAEAEYDAGNDAEAIAAADAAIALDPSRTNAYIQKGFALFRRALEAEDQEAAYKTAMAPFSQLNAREVDHPLPLIYYYRSYVQRGLEPPENAKHALERAAQLAPFDHDLWMNVAIMQMFEGKIALAQASLQPLASDPHGGGRAEHAARYLAALSHQTEGEPFDPFIIAQTPSIVSLDSDGSGESENE